MENVDGFDVEIKTILFDGANTKMSVVSKAGDIILISLPQNAKFEGLKEGDHITVGITYDDIKCYKD